MPSIGEKSYRGTWDGTKWIKSSDANVVGSGKSEEQIKGELGYKAGPKPAGPAPTGGLAGYAAKNRVKTMEEQAAAVEEAEKPKKAPKKKE